MIRVPPPPGIQPQLSGNTQSTNWSGYAAATSLSSPAGGSVSDVTGSWVVPTVTGGATNSYCADWLGIDGYLSTTVEQLGTLDELVNGSPSYFAWYEMYPAAVHTIPMAISPGDVMQAEVHWESGNTFTLSLTDATTGATFSTQQTLSTTALRTSAEWIHEAPSSGSSLLPLAQTTPVTFTSCMATINGTNGPLGSGSWQNTGINMVQGGTVIEQAFPLSAGGTSFVVAPPGTLPHITPSSAPLTFNYVVGGATPAAQNLTLTNGGGGTLNWSAASDSPSWLSCTPTSGGSGASTSVSVDPSALDLGSYTGHVVVTALGADNPPQSVPVTLNVLSVAPPTLLPVYRFRNLKNGYYLWTASAAEKNNIVATLSSEWMLEGVAYQIDLATNTSPLWRFRNLRAGFYLYTADPVEKANIVAGLSNQYVLEGVAYDVSLGAGAPVWRFRNKANGTYFYTADPVEKANIVSKLAASWQLEGPAFYIAP
jgi:hypothetical protein